MSRRITNLIVDLTAAFLFFGMSATGYVLRFPLPPGTNKALTLWGFTRHQWGGIHFWLSLGLLGILLVHVVLHWRWLVTVIGRRLHLVKTAELSLLRSGGAALLIVVAAFTVFAWATHSSVREITAPIPGVCPPDELVPGETSSPPFQTDNSQQPIAFWRDVYPLLEKKCLSCHGPRKQFGGFRVDRRSDFFRRNGKEPLILPGRSADSPLLAVVSGARKDMLMADRHKLPEQEVSLLKAWVDAGADWPARRGSSE